MDGGTDNKEWLTVFRIMKTTTFKDIKRESLLFWGKAVRPIAQSDKKNVDWSQVDDECDKFDIFDEN